MDHDRLERMVKGWFVGDFQPSVLETTGFEVAIKHYSAGDFEQAHFHKKAHEITVVVAGEVSMNGRIWSAGDILAIKPGEATDFAAITDAITVVVKTPSVRGDKFPFGDSC